MSASVRISRGVCMAPVTRRCTMTCSHCAACYCGCCLSSDCKHSCTALATHTSYAIIWTQFFCITAQQRRSANAVPPFCFAQTKLLASYKTAVLWCWKKLLMSTKRLTSVRLIQLQQSHISGLMHTNLQKRYSMNILGSSCLGCALECTLGPACPLAVKQLLLAWRRY